MNRRISRRTALKMFGTLAGGLALSVPFPRGLCGPPNATRGGRNRSRRDCSGFRAVNPRWDTGAATRIPRPWPPWLALR